MLRPTVGSGLVISWAGMRGIVSLAAALALPQAFPFRGLIVLTAFFVVLGTLVLQGLTLGPLLRRLNLHDDDPVGREVRCRARARVAGPALATLRTPDRRSRTRSVRSSSRISDRRMPIPLKVKPVDPITPACTAGAGRGAPGRSRHARQPRDWRRRVSPHGRRTSTGSRWRTVRKANSDRLLRLAVGAVPPLFRRKST
jgi:NhaP-type Na+/H+ or K+/H+ antiporter